jgi:valyl-tRNA synthetase
MIMMSIYCAGEVPFPHVFIHGLVRDEKGRKMSKSQGNVIDPLSLCGKYGADSVRFTLATLSSPGRDLKMSDQSVEIGRNFLTKLWNVVRFAQMNGCIYNKEFTPKKACSSLAKWIVHEIKQMVINVEKSMEEYRFDEVSRHIYSCVWDLFCNWYMEFTKVVLQQPISVSAIDARADDNLTHKTLVRKDARDATAWAIVQFVRVLYPIAPFISKKLSGEMGVLDMSWPDLAEMDIDCADAVQEIDFLKEVISSIRSMKQCLNIPVSEKLIIYIDSHETWIGGFVANYNETLSRMAGVSVSSGPLFGRSVPIVVGNSVIHIGFEGKLDIMQERERLRDEISKLTKMRNNAVVRLSSDDFMRKASEEVIQEHKDRVANIDGKIQKINYVIQSLDVM